MFVFIPQVLVTSKRQFHIIFSLFFSLLIYFPHFEKISFLSSINYTVTFLSSSERYLYDHTTGTDFLRQQKRQGIKILCLFGLLYVIVLWFFLLYAIIGALPPLDR